MQLLNFATRCRIAGQDRGSDPRTRRSTCAGSSSSGRITGRPADRITDAELVEVDRAAALFDAHCEDPEFGYRDVVDDGRKLGQSRR